jgi:hypothetical protein
MTAKRIFVRFGAIASSRILLTDIRSKPLACR